VGQVIYSGVGKLDRQFFVTLSALQQQGAAKVRTNPRVIARCGEESTIGIRKTDNFFYQSGLDLYGHPSFTKSDISAEIILKLTPQLLGSGEIAMALDATIETFTFAVANDLPDTTRRQAVTDVVCRDGDSIIIGGLTQDEETKVVTKTPLLGDLPLIGQLFRQTRRNSRNTTLVIFVTPHLVSETNQPPPASTPLPASGTP
jgi:general secretion pathway protein D